MKKRNLSKLVLNRQSISLLTGRKVKGGQDSYPYICISKTCPKPPAPSDKCSDMVTCATCITCGDETCANTCYCQPTTDS